jgi:hypothetical protein
MRHLLGFWFGLMLATGCGATAPATGTVEVTSAALVAHPSDAAKARLELELANGTPERAYYYESLRSVIRDESADRTTLRLRDQPCRGDLNDAHLILPEIRHIDAREYKRIAIDVYRQYNQLVAPAEGETEPTFRTVPVIDAASVHVELAWSDRAFTVPANAGVCMADFLIEMESGIASATID